MSGGPVGGPSLSRVVALIDMDCFCTPPHTHNTHAHTPEPTLHATTHATVEPAARGSPFPPPRRTDCACERALDSSLEGVPLAVVQYNPFQGDGSASASGVVSIPAEPAAARVVFKGGRLLMPSAANGSIIAVSYEARARGVTRFFRGREAIAKCPEIVLVQVPTAHGKSDMGIYRSFGARVLKIISETCGAGSLTEKASVDEVYVDVTAPARRALAAATCASEVFDAAAAAGTHVAGGAEGAQEAERGAQPGGVLARNAFRAGHAGQLVRAIDAASDRWWSRPASEWL